LSFLSNRMSGTKEAVFQGYKISAYGRQYLDEYWVGNYKITQDGWPIRESEPVTYQRTEAAAQAHALVMGVRYVNECLVRVAALRSKVFRYLG
jgi:hypothetical protein